MSGGGAAARQPPTSELPQKRGGRSSGGLPALIAWALAGLAVLALAVSTFLAWRISDAASAIRFSDVPPGAAKIAAGAWEEHRILPPKAMDARWWVSHAKMLAREGGLRLRHSQLDNAPHGREVHWSMAIVWWLVLVAAPLAWLAGTPIENQLATAALPGPPLLFLALLGLWLVLARRTGRGAFASGILALALLTMPPVLRAFEPGDPDHHGLVALFMAMSVFSLAVGGAGWVRRRGQGPDGAWLPESSARWWFRAAGFWGGAGLWVSAATALPVLAACGLAGLAAVLLSRREGFSAKWVPRLWIEWGMAGALASLFFYLLEYFPFAMGWRLEVNHPLWAMAWLGGAWIIAEAGAMAAGRPLLRDAVPRAAVLLCAGLAMAAPVVLALGRGSATFWVSDPWLLELHHKMIFEFQSLPSMLAIGPKNLGTLSLAIWPVAGIVAGILLWRAGGSNWPMAIRLVVAGAPALTMLALALVQVRWLSALFPVVAVCVWLLAAEAWRCRWVQGILLAAGAAALALGPAREAGSQARLLARIEAGDLPGPVRGSLFLRDVAHRLNQASPSSPPVVLCGPNDATELVYYGALRTVGTLYWENLEGLRRAADLFAEAEGGRVKQALEQGGFSHLVLTAWDPNALIMAALGGRGATTVRKSFLARVLAREEDLPDWLRPLCYPIPGPDGLDAESVRLFAFVPRQGRGEALYYRGLFEEEAGRREQAAGLYKEAVRLLPGDERPGEGLQRLGIPRS